jgi:hypothetical protein
MNDRLAVNEKSQLEEISVPERPPQPATIKFFANFFSYIFHPLFIPVYITLFLLFVHPYIFAGLDDWGKLGNLLQVFVNCTFLPIMSILLLKGLKFIDSVYLKTQKERIVPYMICMIFYFWNWYAFKNNHGVTEIISLSMAVFIASVFGFLANISLKISMHTIAVGVMSTFMALLAFHDSMNLTLYLSASFLITGIVCSSRLIVSDHSIKEVYSGLAIGMISQLLAHYFTTW